MNARIKLMNYDCVQCRTGNMSVVCFVHRVLHYLSRFWIPWTKSCYFFRRHAAVRSRWHRDCTECVALSVILRTMYTGLPAVREFGKSPGIRKTPFPALEKSGKLVNPRKTGKSPWIFRVLVRSAADLYIAHKHCFRTWSRVGSGDPADLSMFSRNFCWNCLSEIVPAGYIGSYNCCFIVACSIFVVTDAVVRKAIFCQDDRCPIYGGTTETENRNKTLEKSRFLLQIASKSRCRDIRS